jgi:hypothetical protein
VIANNELSLQKAYDDFCDEVMKVNKLNKKLFNKLTREEQFG